MTLSPALTGVHASPKIWIRNQCSHISATLLLTPPSPQSSFTSKKILPPSSLFSNFVNKLSSTHPTAPFSFHSINLTSSLQFLILFLSPKNRPSSRFHLHDPLQDHAYTPLQPLTQRHTSGIWVHVSQRNNWMSASYRIQLWTLYRWLSNLLPLRSTLNFSPKLKYHIWHDFLESLLCSNASSSLTCPQPSSLSSLTKPCHKTLISVHWKSHSSKPIKFKIKTCLFISSLHFPSSPILQSIPPPFFLQCPNASFHKVILELLYP